MKKEIIKHLTNDFESYANQTQNGVEFWFGRDLQHLLGYTEWRNFTKVVNKAKTACETTGHLIVDHFVDVNKTIVMPKGASKEIPDFMLTRFARYLIAQNGDPQKEPIAFAKNYIAVRRRTADRCRSGQCSQEGSWRCHGIATLCSGYIIYPNLVQKKIT